MRSRSNLKYKQGMAISICRSVWKLFTGTVELYITPPPPVLLYKIGGCRNGFADSSTCQIPRDHYCNKWLLVLMMQTRIGIRISSRLIEGRSGEEVRVEVYFSSDLVFLWCNRGFSARASEMHMLILVLLTNSSDVDSTVSVWRK